MDRCRILCVVLSALFAGADASPPTPDQGFFMVANLPQVGRNRGFYLYAIHAFRPTAIEEIEFNKDGTLPPHTPGQLPNQFGCYMYVWPTNRQPAGARYGEYTGTFTPPSGQPVSSYTFVKAPSKILDTGGVYTITVYPDNSNSERLSEPVSIGVKWRPGCQGIVWSKGRRRKINRGPRLTLKSTRSAGLYTIFRPTRGKRGWFVQILVIAASCPDGQYRDESGVCQSDFMPCLNGGVLMDGVPDCMCPPFFIGDRCACVTSAGDYLLGLFGTPRLHCGDLPGGNPTCKGHLVCYGDNYGCKCSSGWHGNACDKACPEGWYGANCMQKCPDDESDCSRFFGPKTLRMPDGCNPYV